MERIRRWRWPLIWAGWGSFAVGAEICEQMAHGLGGAHDTAASLLLVLPVVAALASLMLGLLWAAFSIQYAVQRRWPDFLATLFGPAFGMLTVCAWVWAALHFGWSPRFWTARPQMEAEIARAPDHPQYREFPWDITGFAGQGDTEQTMVYDATDRLPTEVDSGRTKWPPAKTVVAAMGHHFYWVSEYLD